MMLLTHWAGLRIGEVACLRWSDVTTTDGEIKDEIRLLPYMTKGRHARTVFVSAKLRAELQAYAQQAKCVDRSYPFFASQKSIKSGFGANSLAQTFALLYDGAARVPHGLQRFIQSFDTAALSLVSIAVGFEPRAQLFLECVKNARGVAAALGI
jgi:integrase